MTARGAAFALHFAHGGIVREKLFNAIRTGDAPTVEKILADTPELAELRDEQGISALLTALYHRQDDIASRILERHPEMDIFDAAAAGDLDRVRHFLDADPSLVTAYSPDGWTALHLAAFFGRPDVVDLLIDRGAGIDMLSTSMGNTALQAATANGQSKVVRRLLDRNAEVDYATVQGGFTALHGAANGGQTEIAGMLLDAGADPSARTDDGKTPRDLAAARGHDEIVALIDDRTERGKAE